MTSLRQDVCIRRHIHTNKLFEAFNAGLTLQIRKHLLSLRRRLAFYFDQIGELVYRVYFTQHLGAVDRAYRLLLIQMVPWERRS